MRCGVQIGGQRQGNLARLVRLQVCDLTGAGTLVLVCEVPGAGPALALETVEAAAVMEAFAGQVGDGQAHRGARPVCVGSRFYAHGAQSGEGTRTIAAGQSACTQHRHKPSHGNS
jgi:hypothetical protein